MIWMKRTPSRSRSRPSSRLVGCFLAAFLVLAGPVLAQTTIQVQPPILVIDQDRLFSETQLGAKSIAEIESGANALQEENKKIEEALISEERALTQKRASMPVDEFRALADEFDRRVQRIRLEQDEKARLLTRAQDEARGKFFQDVAEIISEIVRERGALVVLDRRDVFLSSEQIDITDQAIARVNAAEGRVVE